MPIRLTPSESDRVARERERRRRARPPRGPGPRPHPVAPSTVATPAVSPQATPTKPSSTKPTATPTPPPSASAPPSAIPVPLPEAPDTAARRKREGEQDTRRKELDRRLSVRRDTRDLQARQDRLDFATDVYSPFLNEFQNVVNEAGAQGKLPDEFIINPTVQGEQLSGIHFDIEGGTSLEFLIKRRQDRAAGDEDFNFVGDLLLLEEAMGLVKIDRENLDKDGFPTITNLVDTQKQKKPDWGKVADILTIPEIAPTDPIPVLLGVAAVAGGPVSIALYAALALGTKFAPEPVKEAVGAARGWERRVFAKRTSAALEHMGVPELAAGLIGEIAVPSTALLAFTRTPLTRGQAFARASAAEKAGLLALEGGFYGAADITTIAWSEGRDPTSQELLLGAVLGGVGEPIGAAVLPVIGRAAGAPVRRVGERLHFLTASAKQLDNLPSGLRHAVLEFSAMTRKEFDTLVAKVKQIPKGELLERMGTTEGRFLLHGTSGSRMTTIARGQIKPSKAGAGTAFQGQVPGIYLTDDYGTASRYARVAAKGDKEILGEVIAYQVGDNVRIIDFDGDEFTSILGRRPEGTEQISSTNMVEALQREGVGGLKMSEVVTVIFDPGDIEFVGRVVDFDETLARELTPDDFSGNVRTVGDVMVGLDFDTVLEELAFLSTQPATGGSIQPNSGSSRLVSDLSQVLPQAKWRRLIQRVTNNGLDRQILEEAMIRTTDTPIARGTFSQAWTRLKATITFSPGLIRKTQLSNIAANFYWETQGEAINSRVLLMLRGLREAFGLDALKNPTEKIPGVTYKGPPTPGRGREESLLREFADMSRRTSAAEKPGVIPPSLQALERKDWKAFSRAQGYTEAEIGDFGKFLNLAKKLEQRGIPRDDLAGIDRALSRGASTSEAIGATVTTAKLVERVAPPDAKKISERILDKPKFAVDEPEIMALMERPVEGLADTELTLLNLHAQTWFSSESPKTSRLGDKVIDLVFDEAERRGKSFPYNLANAQEALLGARAAAAPQGAEVRAQSAAVPQGSEYIIGTMADIIERPELYDGLTNKQAKIAEAWSSILDADLNVTRLSGVDVTHLSGIYVPHRIADANNPALHSVYNSVVGGGGRRFTTRRQYPTLVEYASVLARHGLEAELDPLSLFTSRLTSAAKARTNAVYVKGVANTFGRFDKNPGAKARPGERTLDTPFAGKGKYFIPEDIAAEVTHLTRPFTQELDIGVMEKVIDSFRATLLSADMSYLSIQGYSLFAVDPVRFLANFARSAPAIMSREGFMLHMAMNAPRYARFAQAGGTLYTSVLDLPARKPGFGTPQTSTLLPPIGYLNETGFNRLLPMMKMYTFEGIVDMLKAARDGNRAQSALGKLPVVGPKASKFIGKPVDTVWEGIPVITGIMKKIGGLAGKSDWELERAAADVTNNIGGGVNWAVVGRNPAVLSKFFILTEGWLRNKNGLITQAAHVGDPAGVAARRALAQQLGLTALISSGLSLLMTGEYPEFRPNETDFLDIRTPQGSVALLPGKTHIRTISRLIGGVPWAQEDIPVVPESLGDIQARIETSFRFTEGRQGQFVRTIIDLKTGEDFLGRKIDNKILYVVESLLPIVGGEAMRSVQEGVEGQDFLARLLPEFMGLNFIPTSPFDLRDKEVAKAVIWRNAPFTDLEGNILTKYGELNPDQIDEYNDYDKSSKGPGYNAEVEREQERRDSPFPELRMVDAWQDDRVKTVSQALIDDQGTPGSRQLYRDRIASIRTAARFMKDFIRSQEGVEPLEAKTLDQRIYNGYFEEVVDRALDPDLQKVLEQQPDIGTLSQTLDQLSLNIDSDLFESLERNYFAFVKGAFSPEALEKLQGWLSLRDAEDVATYQYRVDREVVDEGYYRVLDELFTPENLKEAGLPPAATTLYNTWEEYKQATLVQTFNSLTGKPMPPEVGNLRTSDGDTWYKRFELDPVQPLNNAQAREIAKAIGNKAFGDYEDLRIEVGNRYLVMNPEEICILEYWEMRADLNQTLEPFTALCGDRVPLR